MTQTKSIEVYEEFEPWMIGETVEIGLYSKSDRKNAEPHTGSHVVKFSGVLTSYFAPVNGTSVVRFRHAKDGFTFTTEYEYLISVIEDRNR